jgi:hypothetical protein
MLTTKHKSFLEETTYQMKLRSMFAYGFEKMKFPQKSDCEILTSKIFDLYRITESLEYYNKFYR